VGLLGLEHAIYYAQNRASFRSGEIPILDSVGNVARRLIVKIRSGPAVGCIAC